jgi:Tol biopolymer transport system component
VLPLRGGSRTPRPLREVDADDSQAQFSPDGKWVALTSTETGSREVYLVRFPDGGAKVRVSIGGGQQPRWADNGRELLFWSSRSGDARLMSVSVATTTDPPVVSTPRALFGMLAPSIWDVAPDGRFLLETVPAAQAGSVMVTVTNWFDELRRRAPPRQ